MTEKMDTVIKNFFDRPEIVADALNSVVYKETIVSVDEMKPVDLVPVFQLLADTSGEQTVEEYQQTYRRTVVMMSEEICCVIMGESEVSYDLPIKARLLEGGLYAEQASHQDTSVSQPKLTPVITLVFYLSPKDWEGHYKLSDMYPEMDETIRFLAPEYRLNMVEPAKLSEEELSGFSTELGKVLRMTKSSGNGNCVGEVLADESVKLSESAKELIQCLSNADAQV